MDFDLPPRPSRSGRPRSRPIGSQWKTFVNQSDRAVDWAGDKLAYCLAGLIAIALWAIGAHFTNIGLTAVFPFLRGLGAAIWIIPLGISMVEMRFFQRSGLHTLIFTIVSAVDVLTTVYGSLEWAAGRTFRIGAGVTMPESGPVLVIPITALSFALTFGPERILSWALANLVGLYEE